MEIKMRHPTKNLFLLLGIGTIALGLGGFAGRSHTSRSFSSKQAWQYLLDQVRYGPRPIGSFAHEKCRYYLFQQLKKVTDHTEFQDFHWPLGEKRFRLSNIIGVINPQAERKILLGAHWDTRPTADREKEEEKRKQPIPGANDGASGVAVLLEVARVLKRYPPKVGVVFAFFDGEDYGPTMDRMFLGSRYFAEYPGRWRPERAIIVDMVGDNDLKIRKEFNSISSDRQTVEKIWSIARDLGYQNIFVEDDSLPNIYDDHIPLQQKGIPAIDLIDFEYPYWHTLEDTPDKCSPQSLKIVGEVLLEYIRGL